jgi:hypothetical protein
MKLLRAVVVVVLLTCAGYLAAQYGGAKLWVHTEYRSESDRVLFIEDLETGTRCYAITNDKTNLSGYAISCVPKH